MGLSHDVELPREKIPVFPDRCVVCGGLRPRATQTITEETLSGWTVLQLFSFFAPSDKHYRVTVPTCTPCARSLKRARLIRGILQTAFVSAAISLGAYLDWSIFAIVGACVLAVLPIALVEVLRPPPFGLTAGPRRVTFEFRDERYAEEFAAANDAEVD